MNALRTSRALLASHDVSAFLSRARPLDLVVIVLIAGFGYGAVMGSFSLRPLQACYSGIKVPILLTASALVCLPSFFVLNTVLGLRDDLSQVMRSLVATQITTAIVLLSFAPVTALAYVSSSNYRFGVVFNGVIFLAASLVGFGQLRRAYQPLIVRDPRHRFGLRCWLVLNAFVTIQLSWMLRPFIGSPEIETSFLRPGVWDNAYVVVAKSVWELLSR